MPIGVVQWRLPCQASSERSQVGPSAHTFPNYSVRQSGILRPARELSILGGAAIGQREASHPPARVSTRADRGSSHLALQREEEVGFIRTF
jgi:hypothetical protein